MAKKIDFLKIKTKLYIFSLILVSLISLLLCGCGKSAEGVLTAKDSGWFLFTDCYFSFDKDGDFVLFDDSWRNRYGKYTMNEDEILIKYMDSDMSYAEMITSDIDIDWDNIDREELVIFNYTFDDGELKIDDLSFKSISDYKRVKANEKTNERIAHEIAQNRHS